MRGNERTPLRLCRVESSIQRLLMHGCGKKFPYRLQITREIQNYVGRKGG